MDDEQGNQIEPVERAAALRTEVERLRGELSSQSRAVSELDKDLAKSRISGRRLWLATALLAALLVVSFALYVVVFDRAVSWLVARKCAPGALTAAAGPDTTHLEWFVMLQNKGQQETKPCSIDIDSFRDDHGTDAIADLVLTCTGERVFSQRTAASEHAHVRVRLKRSEFALTYLAYWDDQTGGNVVCLNNRGRESVAILHDRDSSRVLLERGPRCAMPND